MAHRFQQLTLISILSFVGSSSFALNAIECRSSVLFDNQEYSVLLTDVKVKLYQTLENSESVTGQVDLWHSGLVRIDIKETNGCDPQKQLVEVSVKENREPAATNVFRTRESNFDLKVPMGNDQTIRVQCSAVSEAQLNSNCQ